MIQMLGPWREPVRYGRNSENRSGKEVWDSGSGKDTPRLWRRTELWLCSPRKNSATARGRLLRLIERPGAMLSNWRGDKDLHVASTYTCTAVDGG